MQMCKYANFQAEYIFAHLHIHICTFKNKEAPLESGAVLSKQSIKTKIFDLLAHDFRD